MSLTPRTVTRSKTNPAVTLFDSRHLLFMPYFAMHGRPVADCLEYFQIPSLSNLVLPLILGARTMN